MALIAGGWKRRTGRGQIRDAAACRPTGNYCISVTADVGVAKLRAPGSGEREGRRLVRTCQGTVTYWGMGDSGGDAAAICFRARASSNARIDGRDASCI